MSTFDEIKSKYVIPSNKMLIGGEQVDAISGETYAVKCPCNGEVIATCAKGDSRDVDRAVEAAKKAQPAWAKVSSLEKAHMLYKIADLLDESLEQINWIDALEVGKTFTRFASSDSWRYYGGCAASREGMANTTVDHRVNLALNEPIGIVGQISAWNGPVVMAAMKIPPALAAGNCIVYRPSSSTPLATLKIAELASKILPPGVLNVVTGPSSTCGQAILDHPGIRKISFTGSAETGVHVAQSAANKLIPSTMELGGKSANIFFDDCDFQKAMMGFYMGIYVMTGQMCAAGSRVFVQEGIYDQMLQAAVQMAKDIKVGHVWEDDVQMGPLHSEEQLDKVLAYMEIGRQEGATILCGGERLTGPKYDKGSYISPGVMEGNNTMRVAREEIFGPMPLFIKFKTEEEVIEQANDNDYGLAGGVWSRDINKCLRVARGVQTGSMWVNTYNQMFPAYPYGGYKNSGYGREMHMCTLDHFSQKKSIVINTSETLPV